MLTVRNMRPNPEPKVDKTLLWVGGMIVLALVLWMVGSKTISSSASQDAPTPVKATPAAK